MDGRIVSTVINQTCGNRLFRHELALSNRTGREISAKCALKLALPFYNNIRSLIVIFFNLIIMFLTFFLLFSFYFDSSFAQ